MTKKKAGVYLGVLTYYYMGESGYSQLKINCFGAFHEENCKKRNGLSLKFMD